MGEPRPPGSGTGLGSREQREPCYLPRCSDLVQVGTLWGNGVSFQ